MGPLGFGLIFIGTFWTGYFVCVHLPKKCSKKKNIEL